MLAGLLHAALHSAQRTERLRVCSLAQTVAPRACDAERLLHVAFGQRPFTRVDAGHGEVIVDHTDKEAVVVSGKVFQRAARRIGRFVKVALIKQHHAEVVLKARATDLVVCLAQQAQCAAIAHSRFVQVALMTRDQS